MSGLSIFLFCLIMSVTMTVSGVIGFAGNILALPLLTQIFDLPTAVAVLALSALVQCIVQAIQNRRYIHWRPLASSCLYIAAGTLAGYFGLYYVSETILTTILGLFVLALAIRQLRAAQTADEQSAPVVKNNWDVLYLLGGGFFTGAFASGGPLLVIYFSKYFPDKNAFRSAMFLTGLLSLGIVVLGGLKNAQYTPQVLLLTAIAAAILFIAIPISGRIVRAIDERKFRMAVNIALIVIAIALLARTALSLL